MSAGRDLPPGLIGVPAKSWMWTESALSLHRAIRAAPDGTDVCMELGSCTIASKRNEIVRGALEGGFEWLLFVDADMKLPEGVVARLLEVEDADLVSGVYTSRQPRGDIHVNAGEVLDRGTPDDGLRPYTSDASIRSRRVLPSQVRGRDEPFEVDVAGTGCLLIRRHVLEAMDPPWFAADDEGRGEDLNFTLRTSDAGFRLLLAPDVRAGHFAAHPYGLDEASDTEQAKAAAVDELKSVLPF